MTFATLFDSGYLSRGVMLYKSLDRCCKTKFQLFILALDSGVSEFFDEINDERITIVHLNDLERIYKVLLKLKSERTRAEFCWTLASFFVQFVLSKYDVESCTYVDADVYFFNDPEYLIALLKDESVLITEHNFTPEYDKTVDSGKFCVQFNYFKNNKAAKSIVEWWRSKCENACTVNVELGLCGDQKYLDDWESRFAGDVYSCHSLGCLAPWNVQKVDLINENNCLYVQDRITKVKEPLIFFHFHLLRRIVGNIWRVPGYRIDDGVFKCVYGKYIQGMYLAEKECAIELIEAYDKAEIIEIGMFLPMPFMGEEKELVYRWSRDENKKALTVNYENRFGIVRYMVMENRIVIELIEGDIVFENFHQVLWSIQKRECYAKFSDIYSMITEIISRAENKEKIRTECPMTVFSGRMINHPAFYTNEFYKCWLGDENYTYINKKLTKCLEQDV